MAENKSFPNIPVSHWYKLRTQLKKSIPGAISSNYVASVLGKTETSAKANVIPSLRMIGLIDENDKTNQELAKKFRDDNQYKSFCDDILNRLYPEGVLDAFPDSDSNKDGLKTWFMNHTGIGSSAASRIAAFYLALLEANVNFEIKSTNSTPKKSSAKVTKTPIQRSNNKEENRETKQGTNQNQSDTNKYPELNINIQIHISSDATPDQIEKIFESMSKHIYKNK